MKIENLKNVIFRVQTQNFIPFESTYKVICALLRRLTPKSGPLEAYNVSYGKSEKITRN